MIFGLKYGVIVRLKDGSTYVNGPLGRWDAFWTQKYTLEHDHPPFADRPRCGVVSATVVRILDTKGKL